MASKKNNNELKGKEKAIDIALKQIEKEYGKGAVMRMGGESPLDEI